jgi:copper chaperone
MALEVLYMIELTLPTMTCGHCVKAVTAAVQQVDAAAKLQVDLATRQVRIESTRPAAEFERALVDEGYAPA